MIGEINPSEYDFFFVIRTSSPIIGGPSAGAIMATVVTSLLQNWTMDSKTMMTGMINPDGSIGPVGGILQKIDAAYVIEENTWNGQTTIQMRIKDLDLV